MRVKNLPEDFCSGLFPLFTLQKVHICMPHSQPINYIVYSVRGKTCTAPDRFVYFLDYYCIGQQGIIAWKALGRDCTNNNGLILQIGVLSS